MNPKPKANNNSVPVAKHPFEFKECILMLEPIGRRSQNLREFLEAVKTVPDSVIYHHMFRTYFVRNFEVWDYPNEFARWIAFALGDSVLAEKLSSFDPYEFPNIGALRAYIAEVIEDHVWSLSTIPWARPGYELFFQSSKMIVVSTEIEAFTVKDLREGISAVNRNSIYYHFHESRHRLGANLDDFTLWLEDNFKCQEICKAIRDIDFYFFSLEELKDRLARLLDAEIRRLSRG